MNRLFFLIWTLLLLLVSSESGGQALLTGNDSVRVRKDTTIHLVIKDFRGNIQWQRSLNGVTWNNMTGKTRDTLIILPDQEAAYRAMVTEGSCKPVYSGSALIIFLKPTVSTNPVTAITAATAVCGGNITDDGGADITVRGVCWSTSPDPVLSGNKTTNGQGPGSFIANLSGLAANTRYYIRAYAANSKGTAYGDQKDFTTLPVDANTVTDIDGNIYQTIKIGDQTWMKQNLRVTHAPDGSAIVSTLCDPQNEQLYGRLYSWDVAMKGSTTEKARGICPDGWHVPTDEEVKLLEIQQGMTRAVADLGNTWRGSPVGTLLKTGGSSGFDLPLAGLNTSPGSCFNVGLSGYLWTSTRSGSGYPWRRCFNTTAEVGRWDTWPHYYGLSVRCIKN